MVEKLDSTLLDLTSSLTGEMLLLGLLGKVLYNYPGSKTNAWFQSMVDDGVFAEAPFAGEQLEVRSGLQLINTWVRESYQPDPDEAMLALQVDYTKLFACAGKLTAPPWESVYRNKERLVLQEETLAIRRWYRRFGLAVKDSQTEPEDHIGLELLFVAHLVSLALQAGERGDQARFNETMRAQGEFLEKHLLLWAPLWADQVELHAKTDFYRGLALLTKGALVAAAALLDLTAPAEAPEKLIASN